RIASPWHSCPAGSSRCPRRRDERHVRRRPHRLPAPSQPAARRSRDRCRRLRPRPGDSCPDRREPAAARGAAVRRARGSRRSLVRAAGTSALPILVLSVLVSVAVNRGGLTVFARLGDWGVLGQMNLTVESLVYGLVFGLRLMVVTLACLLVVCAAAPDELLFACRRISPHSALTAALTTRLIPVLAGDARRLAEAQRCRPDGGATGARGRLAILRATVGGALDRSLDVAAVLEMRGYGARRGGGRRTRGRSRSHRQPRSRSRHDLAFAPAAVAGVAA